MKYPERDGIAWDPRSVRVDPAAGGWGGVVRSFDPAICAPLGQKGVRMVARDAGRLIAAGETDVKVPAIRDRLRRDADSDMAARVSGGKDHHDASSPADIDRASSEDRRLHRQAPGADAGAAPAAERGRRHAHARPAAFAPSPKR